MLVEVVVESFGGGVGSMVDILSAEYLTWDDQRVSLRARVQ